MVYQGEDGVVDFLRLAAQGCLAGRAQRYGNFIEWVVVDPRLRGGAGHLHLTPALAAASGSMRSNPTPPQFRTSLSAFVVQRINEATVSFVGDPT